MKLHGLVCSRAFARDERGAVVIETAFVLPVLLLLMLGSFDASKLISRQYELQSAAAEAEQIALATESGATTDMDTIKSILRSSVDLNSDQISITRFYRCSDDNGLVANPASCDEGETVNSYIEIELRDTYKPVWTHFGIGSDVDLAVDRMVILP